MGQFQKLIVLILFIASAHARAEWGLQVGTAAFQGSLSGGVAYDWSMDHALEFGLGQYVLNNGHGLQMNLGYRYVPLHWRFGALGWSPVGLGLVALYALDQDDYFTKSPGKYPSENYYEQTGVRLGLEFSSQVFTWGGHLRLIYKVILMDSGVIALWNNDGEYAKYFYSAGLALQYFF